MGRGKRGKRLTNAACEVLHILNVCHRLCRFYHPQVRLVTEADVSQISERVDEGRAHEKFFGCRPGHVTGEWSLALRVPSDRLLPQRGVDKLFDLRTELANRETRCRLVDDVLEEFQDGHLMPRSSERYSSDAFPPRPWCRLRLGVEGMSSTMFGRTLALCLL